MKKELFEDGDRKFVFYDEYMPEFLEPVGKYVLWKLANAWDDYNELFHASAYFNKVITTNDLWINSHLMLNKADISGVAFIVGGNLRNIEKRIEIPDEDKSLLLKYFHIVDRGKGFGKKWLNNIIFPYYKNRGYQKIYIGSSHPESFLLYEKFGKCIYEYNSLSDNKLHQRKGRFFEIDLQDKCI